MAKRITAIRSKMPRIKLAKLVEQQEIVSFIAGRTGYNEGAILNMLAELRDMVAFYAKSGRPVKLQGLGIFAPTMDKNGTIKITHRYAGWLKNELNAPGAFLGDIENRDMLNQPAEVLIERWNSEYPDDPVED